MARKTVDVDWLKERVNYFLEHSHEMDMTPEHRLGAASVLELALHETGNYHGFRYLEREDKRLNVWDEPTNQRDESRRRYF